MTATQTSATRTTPRMWRFVHTLAPWAGLAALAARATSPIRGFVKAPVLPYAAVWEANVLVSLLQRKKKDVEPDPFATEMPFLSDSWPRG